MRLLQRRWICLILRMRTWVAVTQSNAISRCRRRERFQCALSGLRSVTTKPYSLGCTEMKMELDAMGETVVRRQLFQGAILSKTDKNPTSSMHNASRAASLITARQTHLDGIASRRPGVAALLNVSVWDSRHLQLSETSIIHEGAVVSPLKRYTAFGPGGSLTGAKANVNRCLYTKGLVVSHRTAHGRHFASALEGMRTCSHPNTSCP